MRISVSWLREWVKFDWSIETLAHKLSMAGLEVDAVERVSLASQHIVVAEVIECVKHPKADKLTLCQVSVGGSESSLQVVCGAPNVKVGLKVPIAMPGAVLPNGMKIKESKLRGELSQGMLCSGEEIGIEDRSEGLLELPADSVLGESLSSLYGLDDTIIEVDLTPNRADCLSMVGIAREVAALSEVPWQYPFKVVETFEHSHQEVRPVSLQAGSVCPLYRGRIIKGINNRIQSPIWLKEKLRRAGVRPINPVVDVTNYVMLEIGQPMHAFDLAKIERSITVRYADSGEKIILLDGREITLKANDVVIADCDEPLALAGIMGGVGSAVLEETQDIFLEAAFFDPVSISGKARSYGLHTDSSHRFERGVCPGLQALAINRATEILLDIVGGQPGPMVEGEMPDSVASELSNSVEIDSYLNPDPIHLYSKNIKRLLGISLAAEKIEGILSRLGMELHRETEQENDYSLRVTPPSFRFDIRVEVDLIEEIARIVGYDDLPKQPMRVVGSARKASNQPLGVRKEHISSLHDFKMLLVNIGYSEVITYSFVDEQSLSYIGDSKALTLKNPISSEMKAMRTSLLPGLINTLKYNQSRQKERFMLFESGLRFQVEESGDLTQIPTLSGLVSGSKEHVFWSKKSGCFDFYDLKGHVMSLIQLAMGDLSFVQEMIQILPASDQKFLHPGQSCKIMLNNQYLGFFGALHPKTLTKFDVDGPIFLFEINLEVLKVGKVSKYNRLSKYPSVKRDLAFVYEKSILADSICNHIAAHAGPCLENVSIFDVYEGQGVEKDNKSGACALTFRHPSRTLKEEEINLWIEKLVESIEDSFSAKLRI